MGIAKFETKDGALPKFGLEFPLKGGEGFAILDAKFWLWHEIRHMGGLVLRGA